MINKLIPKVQWFFSSLWGAYERWTKCDCVDLSAAFAYYTLQSFFPILLISLSVASWFLGKQQGLNELIIGRAAQILPAEVMGLVNSTLTNLSSIKNRIFFYSPNHDTLIFIWGKCNSEGDLNY